MTELELYKFIKENNIEWRWEINREGGREQDDVILLPYIFQFEDFMKLVGDAYDEYPLEVKARKDYVAIWMNHICDDFGIEIENVFPKGGDND